MDSKFQAHYAALKILKQRCEYLQQRVDLMEEENCQLKLQKVQVQEKAVNNPSYNHCLEEQIILLNKQNDRMSHQIKAISLENRNLWSQLSTIMSGDETLGNVLTVSTTLGCKKDETVTNVLDDCSKESLEEISIKLINGILVGKCELKSQYSPMIGLQKENVLENNYMSKTSHFDCRASIGAIKVLVQKMIDIKEALLQQKLDLSSAIKSIKNISSVSQNNIPKSDDLNSINIKGSVCDSSNTSFSVHDSKGNHDDNIKSDKICPMCGKNFTGNFNVFYGHVTSHFEDQEELNIEFFK